MGSFVDNTLGTNIFGENSNAKAAGSMDRATERANAAINAGYQNQVGFQTPFQQAGGNALSALAGGAGGMMQNWQQDPGYQFQLQQGNTAINNAMAARGMGNSGAALKELTRYGQNLASQEYDKVYNRENNRLSMLAGMGQSAANTLTNAAGNQATSLSNNYLGQGNAHAAAAIGQGNQQANLLNQGIQGAAAYFSDERLKTNIKPVPKEELDQLREELKAFYYEYKETLHGDPGRYIGIMAQDLEKTKLGKEIVIENAKGEKMIDLARVHSLFLATMAEAA